MRIAVVGPCGSGKTTLVNSLRAMGYDARECVQEHSYVPTMWERISRPDVLIYLDVGLSTLRQRVPRPDWTPAILEEQKRRLSNARARCHFYLHTDELSPDQVLAATEAFLESEQATLPDAAPADSVGATSPPGC